MKLESPFVALMIGALFFTGLFTIFMTLGDRYDVSYDLTVYNTEGNTTDIESAFDRIQETKENIDNVTAEFEDTNVVESDSLFSFFSLAHKIGIQIFSSLTIFKDLFFIGSDLTGIPPAVAISLFAILMIVFVLLVIFILLGRST